jgi:hypothetical protein
MSLWAQEEWVNATEGWGSGATEVYETGFDSAGDLYRAAVREHGRCVSKVYIDKDGQRLAIGWVFVKRTEYEDSRPRYDDYGRRIKPETFLLETWVTLHEAPPTVTRTPHYHVIATGV